MGTCLAFGRVGGSIRDEEENTAQDRIWSAAEKGWMCAIAPSFSYFDMFDFGQTYAIQNGKSKHHPNFQGHSKCLTTFWIQSSFLAMTINTIALFLSFLLQQVQVNLLCCDAIPRLNDIHL